MFRPYPRAGAQYPSSLGEFQAWFQTDADCLDYLEWLRWPSGFVCPTCGHSGGWRMGDGRFTCADCGDRNSVTAGTIFDRTRTPLTVWFTACWHFATGKDGISALSLKRTLAIGSYQTVWAILHRLRSVLVRPDRERLSGKVEVDETYIGGAEPGLSGGRAQGKKVLTVIAVEILEPKGWGRCRMAAIADASASSLLPFVKESIEPGSTVITDGWNGYIGIENEGNPRVGLPRCSVHGPSLAAARQGGGGLRVFRRIAAEWGLAHAEQLGLLRIPENDPLLLGDAQHDSVNLPVQPGVHGVLHSLGLDGGVDDDLVHAGRGDDPSGQPSSDGGLKEFLHPGFADPLAPSGHLTRVDGQGVLEELLTTEELPIRILDPVADGLLVGNPLEVLEVMQAGH
jgi:transposase-like protein